MNIVLDNVSMSYEKGKAALNSISIEMQSPQLIGLLGPNGAGKSTLIKLLVSGILPTSGAIIYDQKPLKDNESKLKSELGYLPQSFGLYEELTVWQFLDYMCALKGIKSNKEAIETVIGKVNLEDKRKSRIRTLSGGQRQRLGIAQALIGNPKLLILDEPTVGLDPEERINFRNLFSETAQDKLVLLSTHIIEDVQSICNRLIVIHKGKVLFDGTPEVLIARAQGHVGVFLEQQDSAISSDCPVTARVNTIDGISYRIVARKLPAYALPVEPSLEDAYMYMLETQGVEA